MELSITLICLEKKKKSREDMPFAEFALEDLSLPRRVLRGPSCGESVGTPVISQGWSRLLPKGVLQ